MVGPYKPKSAAPRQPPNTEPLTAQELYSLEAAAWGAQSIVGFNSHVMRLITEVRQLRNILDADMQRGAIIQETLTAAGMDELPIDVLETMKSKLAAVK